METRHAFEDFSNYLERPEVLGADFRRYTTRQLRYFLAFKASRRLDDTIEDRRIKTWCVSRELSRRGIAPYWQGLPQLKYMMDEPLAFAYRRDQIYWDMEWLRIQFPGHRCRDAAFQRIFLPGCTPKDLKWVARRKMHAPEKVYLLNLDFEMQVGCVLLRDGKTHRRRMDVKRDTAKFETIVASAATTTPQLTKEHQQNRLLQREAAHLAQFKSALAARIYGYMTGETVTRQRMHALMPELKVPRRRKFGRPVLTSRPPMWTS